jgi:hypothetical protein
VRSSKSANVTLRSWANDLLGVGLPHELHDEQLPHAEIEIDFQAAALKSFLTTRQRSELRRAAPPPGQHLDRSHNLEANWNADASRRTLVSVSGDRHAEADEPVEAGRRDSDIRTFLIADVRGYTRYTQERRVTCPCVACKVVLPPPSRRESAGSGWLPFRSNVLRLPRFPESEVTCGANGIVGRRTGRYVSRERLGFSRLLPHCVRHSLGLFHRLLRLVHRGFGLIRSYFDPEVRPHERADDGECRTRNGRHLCGVAVHERNRKNSDDEHDKEAQEDRSQTPNDLDVLPPSPRGLFFWVCGCQGLSPPSLLFHTAGGQAPKLRGRASPRGQLVPMIPAQSGISLSVFALTTADA